MPPPSTHSSGDFSFLKADSLAILESSQNGAVFRPNESDNNGFHGKRYAADPLRLDVSLRLGRILALTTIVVSLLLLFVVVFRHGVELTRFPVASKSETEKTQLLDSYNSYSGTLVSIVGRPLEIFVALLMQVVVVRCAAVSMLRPEASVKAWVASLALSASVGYLLNNGFNALNVQLRSLEIEPVISLSDLTVTASVKDSWMPISSTSNETHTVSEAVANNSIANTVLRNLVLPREPKAPLICPWSRLVSTTVPDDLLEFGFPARDWQARLLSTALEPQRLRIVVNASNGSVPQEIHSADLPMNASRAAELFMHGLMLVGSYLPVQEASFFSRRVNPNVIDANVEDQVIGRVAHTTGLLPNDTTMSETKQREWFLQRSQAMMASHFISYKPAMGLDFTHLQISPFIAFDAVTFEVEADSTPRNASANTTQSTSTTVDKSNCGPWPALCQFAKPELLRFDDDLYDPAAQVQAFALCVDEHGIESLRASVTYSDGDLQPPTSIYGDCGSTSNSSLLVLSVGKRLVADTLQLNGDGTKVTTTKMRKIFSISFGRLEWTLTKLSEVFNATCEAPRDCLGLHVNLSNSAVAMVSDNLDKNPKQKLVVTADALPLSYVVAPIYDYSWDFGARNMRPMPRSMPLVKVHEPLRPREANALYDILAGDLLLPHNIRQIRWNTTALYAQCNAVLEDRQQLVLKNHLYIEHSLQPAYTAAVFFLLQNGVVKDTIAVNSAKTSLNFDANRQNISLWVSIPKLNAWLTLAGCGLMAACVLTAIVWTVRVTRQTKPDPLTDITLHHAIARVMLDETRFPSLFLRRHVLDASHPRDADSSFQIESMRLSHSSPPDHFVPSSSIQFI